MMRDGKQDAEMDLFFAAVNNEWDQTAHILSRVANLTATKESEIKTPDQLNPTLNAGDEQEDPAIKAEQDAIIAERRAAEAARLAEVANGKQIID